MTGSSARRFQGLGDAVRRHVEARAAGSGHDGDARDAAASLTALAAALTTLLADVRPRLAFALRRGATEAPPALGSREEGPDAGDAPRLFVELHARGLELGLAGGDREATARIRRSLLGEADGALRATCAALLSSGWTPSGEALADGDDGSLPDDLRPWLRRRGLRVTRTLSWEASIGNASLAVEIADRFRDLLPLLDAMRAPLRAPDGT